VILIAELKKKKFMKAELIIERVKSFFLNCLLLLMCESIETKCTPMLIYIYIYTKCHIIALPLPFRDG